MIYAIAVVLVLILDQAVKYWTNVNLEVDEVKELIPGFIQLTNKRNPGAAWGLFENGRWLFVVLTVVACIVIILALRNDYIKGKLGRWMLVLVMAGGLGNFIDRLIYGYVVDMLNFEFVSFPVFNVADIFISVCGIIFCIWLIFHRSDEMEAHAGGPEHESVHRTAGIRTDAQPRTGSHEAQQPGSDYITQLKRPVTQTRAMLERERLEEQRRREDPFAEFYSTPPAGGQPAPRPQAQAQNTRPQPQARPAAPQQQARPAAPHAQQAPRAPQQQARAYNPAPAPTPAPAPAPAPKKSSTEFTLEDILSEFSDK